MPGYRPKKLDELNQIYDKTVTAQRAIQKGASKLKTDEALSKDSIKKSEDIVEQTQEVDDTAEKVTQEVVEQEIVEKENAHAEAASQLDELIKMLESNAKKKPNVASIKVKKPLVSDSEEVKISVTKVDSSHYINDLHVVETQEETEGGVAAQTNQTQEQETEALADVEEIVDDEATVPKEELLDSYLSIMGDDDDDDEKENDNHSNSGFSFFKKRKKSKKFVETDEQLADETIDTVDKIADTDVKDVDTADEIADTTDENSSEEISSQEVSVEVVEQEEVIEQEETQDDLAPEEFLADLDRKSLEQENSEDEDDFDEEPVRRKSKKKFSFFSRKKEKHSNFDSYDYDDQEQTQDDNFEDKSDDFIEELEEVDLTELVSDDDEIDVVDDEFEQTQIYDEVLQEADDEQDYENSSKTDEILEAEFDSLSEIKSGPLEIEEKLDFIAQHLSEKEQTETFEAEDENPEVDLIEEYFEQISIGEESAQEFEEISIDEFEDISSVEYDGESDENSFDGDTSEQSSYKEVQAEIKSNKKVGRKKKKELKNQAEKRQSNIIVEQLQPKEVVQPILEFEDISSYTDPEMNRDNTEEFSEARDEEKNSKKKKKFFKFN